MILGHSFLRTIFLYSSHPSDLLSVSAPPYRGESLSAHQSGPDATATATFTANTSSLEYRQWETPRVVQSQPLIESLQLRRIQRREKPHNRKPKYYWSDLENLWTELDTFWKDRGIVVGNGSAKKNRVGRVVIPNETLLLHYRKHDLRGAIASHGGRYAVAEKLKQAMPSGTSVEVMSGTWTLAVKGSPELRSLIQLDPLLTMELPPKVSSQSRSSIDLGGRRWQHNPTRRPKGYWTNRAAVIQSLYEYVDGYKALYQRPSVWMPPPSELVRGERSDLKEAITRFGGYDEITKVAGMVPYRDWRYLEGQLELLLELKRYCDEHCMADYSIFPRVSTLPQAGYRRLHSLIQTYGGRKFLAWRLGMSTSTSVARSPAPTRLNWGSFDLEFALRLLLFVRADQMCRTPPLRSKQQNLPLSIYIPSEARLFASGAEGLWLRGKFVEFGGYENVARRLGLEFSTEGKLPEG